MNKLALRIDEAADVFGIGQHTLRSLIKAERLPAIYIGTKTLIMTRDLEMFLALNRGVDLLTTDKVIPLENGIYTYEELCG